MWGGLRRPKGASSGDLRIGCGGARRGPFHLTYLRTEQSRKRARSGPRRICSTRSTETIGSLGGGIIPAAELINEAGGFTSRWQVGMGRIDREARQRRRS